MKTLRLLTAAGDGTSACLSLSVPLFPGGCRLRIYLPPHCVYSLTLEIEATGWPRAAALKGTHQRWLEGLLNPLLSGT